MSDYDIHSCGYYCDRPFCIKAQRDELRDKLFSDQAVKTYSGGKPNYTQPIVRITTPEDIAKIKSKWEPTIDGWPLWSGLPQPEPIAYINVEERKLEWATPIKWETPTVVKMDKVPLYAAPPTQPEPEPVAYRYWNEHNKCYFFCEHQESDGSVYEPIFSTPPKREWVGLTNEEIEDIRLEYHYADGAVKVGYERAIEAKLKEKNNG